MVVIPSPRVVQRQPQQRPQRQRQHRAILPARRFSVALPGLLLLLLLVGGVPQSSASFVASSVAPTAAFSTAAKPRLVTTAATIATTGGARSGASCAGARSTTSSRRARGSRSAAPSTALSVSIGLGPPEKKTGDDDAAADDDDDDYQWVEGVDYERPDHESHRLDRRSRLDEACDAWFQRLLRQPPPSSPADAHASNDHSDRHGGGGGGGYACAGPIADAVRTQLLTAPILVHGGTATPAMEPPPPPIATDAAEWTPYLSTRLPWSIVSPAYGLEQYGLPTPRRAAETWRTFDVAGMVGIGIDGALQPDPVPAFAASTSTTSTAAAAAAAGSTAASDADEDHAATIAAVRTALQAAGGWLDDDECAARLVYVNGVFVPSLSLQTAACRNLASADGVGDDDDSVRLLLGRVPDGWTDALACPVPMQQGAPPLTHFATLSAPHHHVGPASSQFAINTAQQGTACFAALNTLQCRNIAYVHQPSPPSPPRTDRIADDIDVGDDAADTDKDGIVANLPPPVLIVNAVTPSGGVSSSPLLAPDDEGVALHPRTVIVAEPHSRLSVVQQSVTIADFATTTNTVAARPVLYNGYTQVLLKDFANVTHTVVEETGGLAVPGTEQSGNDAVRLAEAQRPALRNTVLECLDVHCAGTAAAYTGTVISMGGNGRVRTASTVTLLKPTAACHLRGFSLTGGSCRADTKTCIHHVADGCASQQLQKNMVAGRATSSFRGRIRVEQSAQQTDSRQLSRTVLLTDKCRAWAVPSLEIVADDVQCAHGATVSDLSEEELFYLRSRGLGVTAARNLLMYAFCNDVLTDVPAAVRGTLERKNSDDSDTEDTARATRPGLQARILQRLENSVPTGDRAVRSEYQSV